MSYQDEEQTRLKQQSSKLAVDLAMQGRWQDAVVANKSILERYPGDVDAFNRLARAHMELGDYTLAREVYQKATEIDPYNTIARKNLERLSRLGDVVTDSEAVPDKVEPQQFIGEVGKSGVFNLHNLASTEVLATAVAGNKVTLKVDGPNLLAMNSKGEYLGQAESKHSLRLIKLMVGGNQYSANIIHSGDRMVTIIIREVYQHPSQAGRLSFLPTQSSANQRPNAENRIGEMVAKREVESNETTTNEAGYTIVGGDKTEFLSEAAIDAAGDDDEDEE